MNELLGNSDKTLVELLQDPKDVKDKEAFLDNAGGHFNHSYFWITMSPEMNQKPSGKLGQYSGEKDFADKHKGKKVGEKEDGTVVKEAFGFKEKKLVRDLEKLISNMVVARPTIMTAVPRFYQNLFTKINFNFDKKKGIQKKLINSAHDCADGGFFVSLVEMAMSSSLGCNISLLLFLRNHLGIYLLKLKFYKLWYFLE